jgi:F-type H+-transporting ATPase subunit epsilon
MSKTINLKIITPEKLVYEETVNQVTMPTEAGEITVLPGHIPLVTVLGKGDIVAKIHGEDVPLVAVGGFAKISGDEVVILADFAEHVGDITETEIEKAQNRAQELQKQFENNEIVDFEHFETELARSLARASIGDKWKVRKYRK